MCKMDGEITIHLLSIVQLLKSYGAQYFLFSGFTRLCQRFCGARNKVSLANGAMLRFGAQSLIVSCGELGRRGMPRILKEVKSHYMI